MPIAYDPTAPGPVLFSRSVRRTLLDKTYLITVALFVVLRVSVSVSLTPERAKQFDANLTYPTTLIGTLFALFPQLLETPTLNMGATFPGDL